MARRAVQGFPEKSYYDNTRYKGVVATSDPLNEGYFALLTNWDITDTGLSVVPRKGFTTTLFSVGHETQMLSNKILMYRDPNIQKDIVLDLARNASYGFVTDITQYNLVDNILEGAHIINKYDVADVLSFITAQGVLLTGTADAQLNYVFNHSEIIKDSQLVPIRDLYGVTYNVAKLLFNDTITKVTFNYWLKVLYRKDATTIGGISYTADTLVLSCIDTSVQTTTFGERNLASAVSIIPNPLRHVEAVNAQDSKVSEVRRPILLNISGKYATKNIPNIYKGTLDVNVHPTFYLQDPSKIVHGRNPKWAYRFDIINSSNDSVIPIYKTPWRHLKSPNTYAINPTINQLLTVNDGQAMEYYTYYVVSDKPHSWLETTNATAYLTSLSEAEKKLYEAMRANGLAGSSARSKLGNLAFAYLKHETLANTFKPASIKINDINNAMYAQLGFSFIPEDALITPTINMGKNLAVISERVLSLSAAAVAELQTTPTSYIASTASVSAPIIPLTHADYSKIDRLSLARFKLHANEMMKRKKIRVIFVPNIYRHKGNVYHPGVGNIAGVTVPTDNVYLCSLGGIYVSGLDANRNIATGDIALYSDVVGVAKKFSFIKEAPEAHVDVFSNLLSTNINDTLSSIPRSCFETGIFLKLYLKAYDDDMLATYVDKTVEELALINASWDASSFVQSSVNVWSDPKDVVYIDEVDEENYKRLAESTNWIPFEDRIIVWAGNSVYMSEEGNYGYFTKTMKKEFPQEVLKVIAFKSVVLVFTTQNLHAIYRAEIETATGTFTAKGVPEFETAIVWLQQPVLYNINPERRYLDVIQVYNQMILFYSNEGQLYMIKSSTMINSETEFTIQYFNKSANNIVANFDTYINERLIAYKELDIDDTSRYVTKEDVFIKALIDIDMIKIFYTVPGRITFILNYDVVNNRYTTYDTLSFTSIDSLKHVEGGELYITIEGSKTYFTISVNEINNVDQNVDMHYAKMFKKDPIITYMDSGNLNLNTHIRKRMRDLHIVIKNLTSTKVLYNAELLLDNTVIRPFYSDTFKVKMRNGTDANMKVSRVPIEDMNELFGMTQTLGEEGDRTELNSYYLHHDETFFKRNALLNTEILDSSRLLEYNSSILGVGKVVRIRLQFISKGKYKLQSFGIIYKERRI